MDLDITDNEAYIGDLMIQSIKIHHFKCFKKLEIDNVGRINVIVGDNGSGKTALMEAIFLALGNTTELIGRYRQQRGLDGGVSMGTPQDLEDAVFSDLFFDNDVSKTVMISIQGNGVEDRRVRIDKGLSEKALTYYKSISPNFPMPPPSYKPFVVSWLDSNKTERYVISQFNSQTPQWAGTTEHNTNFFYFAANQTLGPIEAASRFSALSKSFKENSFKEPIISEFNILNDLSIELVAGSGVIHATLKNLSKKIPIPSVSGAINRVVTVLITMAAKQGSIILIDELENGIYYQHHREIWKAIISAARNNNCQIFTTTHSAEWLRGLIEAASDNVSDISLWRMERENGNPTLFQFDGVTLKDGIEYGVDPRGGK